MKILKIIGIVVVAILVVATILISLQPSNGKIEKTIVINAPASKVYRELNGFKTMSLWSPFVKMDTGAIYKSEGPETGVGAKVLWDGAKVGKGSQWIVESIENQKVRCELAFEGYDGKAYADFILVPEGNTTKVTWTYDGTNEGLSGKAMWLIAKGQISKLYSQGLEDLKIYIEGLPDAPEEQAIEKIPL